MRLFSTLRIETLMKNGFGIGGIILDQVVDSAVEDLMTHDIYNVDKDRFISQHFNTDDHGNIF